MPNRYVIYSNIDGYVNNVIIYDGQSEYALDEGMSMELQPENVNVGPGWIRQSLGIYIPPLEQNATD